jgi:hypothetical protein
VRLSSAIGQLSCRALNAARASKLGFEPDLANNVVSPTVVGLNPAAMISKRSFLASNL